MDGRRPQMDAASEGRPVQEYPDREVGSAGYRFLREGTQVRPRRIWRVGRPRYKGG